MTRASSDNGQSATQQCLVVVRVGDRDHDLENQDAQRARRPHCLSAPCPTHHLRRTLGKAATRQYIHRISAQPEGTARVFNLPVEVSIFCAAAVAGGVLK